MIDLGGGVLLYREYFDREAQIALRDAVRDIVLQAPLFQPTMPKTGKALSVKMSNCGALGWVADRQGYRYQSRHPVTGQPWPTMPAMLQELWVNVAEQAPAPQACLINYYEPGAKMGLHQDRDETMFTAPVVSVSLGDTCRFRIGGVNRGGATQSFKLQSGDVLVMGGEQRLAFHGVDRIYPGTSTLLKAPGRINLTLRRVHEEPVETEQRLV
uniref:alpha-ketoglutarate-dependent dioxygenase AlkB family protein n=1 Tax=Pararhizobium sp. IMCC3301 TaxID=3067904 RepID=UPI002741182C|nr:alpha-ketoglutarate-dependent dioxygenase AlkB [Pararhizobium sp. IMCC3301]